ncbi:HNH endonuclease [Thermoplasmatales archaeon AK]|nr:HNH endonuclease [Thermoplasmatales archaeon AK]
MKTKPSPAGVLHHASKSWFRYLSSNGLNDEINFWTKVKKNLTVKEGQLFFFKEHNRIFGAGEVKRTEILTIGEAWHKYGIRNGCDTLDEFISNVRKSGIPLNDITQETAMMCIILGNVQDLPEIPLKDIGLGHVQNLVYLDKRKIHNIAEKVLGIPDSNQNSGTNLPLITQSLAKSRLFQEGFRNKILDAFGRKCVLCDCDTEEVLQASHIVDVADDLSIAADPDNGLCMCANHHAMFDGNLISIMPKGDKGIVRVRLNDNTASVFLKKEYKEMNGKVIELGSPKKAKFLTLRNEILDSKRLHRKIMDSS